MFTACPIDKSLTICIAMTTSNKLKVVTSNLVVLIQSKNI